MHSRSVFARSTRQKVCKSRWARVFDDFCRLFVETMTRLSLDKKICNDLLLQISGILFGSQMDLLRESPEQVERMNKLRLRFAERRTVAAHLGIVLDIHSIYNGVIEASRNSQFFHGLFGKKEAHELYPPESFLDLLDVLPHFR